MDVDMVGKIDFIKAMRDYDVTIGLKDAKDASEIADCVTRHYITIDGECKGPFYHLNDMVGAVCWVREKRKNDPRVLLSSINRLANNNRDCEPTQRIALMVQEYLKSTVYSL